MNIPKFTEKGFLLYNENIRNSYGLYDVTMGVVSGFDFNTQDGFTYDCKTEILSKHANYSGVQFNNATKVSSCDQAQESTIVQTNFASYLEKRLTKIPNCISKVNTNGEIGLNFMEALDEEESDPKKFTPKVGFYDNKPEDRFFVGRKTEYGDTDLMKGKASYDWDNSDQKDIWVTFGFIVELLNVFFTQKMQMSNNDKPYKFYEIETKDVVIGAHPNLISTDAGVLLIPNSTAPKFNSGFYYPLGDPDNNDYQKQNADVGNCFLSYKKENITAKTFDDNKNDDIFKNVNRPLFKVFRTGKSPGIISKEPIQTEGLAGYFKGIASQIGFGELAEVEKNAGKKIIMGVYRDDLDAIINRFRYRKPQQRKFSFPQWVKEPVSQKNAGYWGYLDDLYINKNLINNDDLKKFLHNYNDLFFSDKIPSKKTFYFLFKEIKKISDNKFLFEFALNFYEKKHDNFIDIQTTVALRNNDLNMLAAKEDSSGANINNVAQIITYLDITDYAQALPKKVFNLNNTFLENIKIRQEEIRNFVIDTILFAHNKKDKTNNYIYWIKIYENLKNRGNLQGAFNIALALYDSRITERFNEIDSVIIDHTDNYKYYRDLEAQFKYNVQPSIVILQKDIISMKEAFKLAFSQNKLEDFFRNNIDIYMAIKDKINKIYIFNKQFDLTKIGRAHV